MVNETNDLLIALDNYKKKYPSVELIKVYYLDKDNYTIKGIDKDNKKVITNRKALDKNKEAFDCDYYK